MEVSRFSCMKFLSVRGVCDYAGPGSDSRYRRCRCCLPQPLSESAFPNLIKAFRSSIPGPPMPLFTLHVPPRDGPRKTRGQDGFAISFPAGLFHPLLHAGLSRRTGGPLSGYDSPPLRLTTGLMSPASAARELTEPKDRFSQLRAN